MQCYYFIYDFDHLHNIIITHMVLDISSMGGICQALYIRRVDRWTDKKEGREETNTENLT